MHIYYILYTYLSSYIIMKLSTLKYSKCSYISILVLFYLCSVFLFLLHLTFLLLKRKMMDDRHKIYHSWWPRCAGPTVAPYLSYLKDGPAVTYRIEDWLCPTEPVCTFGEEKNIWHLQNSKLGFPVFQPLVYRRSDIVAKLTHNSWFTCRLLSLASC